MGFKIVVIDSDDDGETREVIHEVEDRRVTKVHVLTKSGEACAIGIDHDQADIAITFDYASATSINLADVDHFKYGYGQNLTGEDVEALADELNEIRPVGNTGGETFTQKAMDTQREAEEAAAKAAEEEPVNA